MTEDVGFMEGLERLLPIARRFWRGNALPAKKAPHDWVSVENECRKHDGQNRQLEQEGDGLGPLATGSGFTPEVQS
ncbi:MAG: hypothetical protein V4794_10340 [Pseudomonadota bacterium]